MNTPQTETSLTVSSACAAPPDLTLRDWFAGQALAGYAAATASYTRESYSDTCARYSYAMADAMLKERGDK